jgi:hypothetical protein
VTSEDDYATGVWETTSLLTAEMVAEDRPILLEIINGFPMGVSVSHGTFVLPSGRIWSFRVLGAVVVV